MLKDWLNTNKRVQDNLLRRKYDVCSRRATVELQPAGATTPSCSYLPSRAPAGRWLLSRWMTSIGEPAISSFEARICFMIGCLCLRM